MFVEYNSLQKRYWKFSLAKGQPLELTNDDAKPFPKVYESLITEFLKDEHEIKTNKKLWKWRTFEYQMLSYHFGKQYFVKTKSYVVI